MNVWCNEHALCEQSITNIIVLYTGYERLEYNNTQQIYAVRIYLSI